MLGNLTVPGGSNLGLALSRACGVLASRILSAAVASLALREPGNAAFAKALLCDTHLNLLESLRLYKGDFT
jgi:hypothetical protein